MSGVQAKKVIGYMVLPGIMPRARALFSSGFGHIAFLMANIYNMVRLLPYGHPYLNPENIGRFGIRHVIAEAANNLVISRKNIDQIAIFVILLASFVLLVLQFALLIYAFIIQPATAASIFDTPNPTNDIAFLLLDNVFGVPNLFCNVAGTCTSIAADLRFPFHVAMHELFRFYSMGLLLIGVIVFLYFVLVVVLETATTGTPFGQRFQNVWVPIRLVMAVGLLVPINYGLNSGQYITLFAAKAGSGFATNGWLLFNQGITDRGQTSGTFAGGSGSNPTGEGNSLLALPNDPDIAPIVQFMSLVHGCAYSYWKQKAPMTDPISVPGGGVIPALPQLQPPSTSFEIKPYFVKMPLPWLSNFDAWEGITETTTYEDGLAFYDNANISIVFGVWDDELYKEHRGNVQPTCGKIRINVGDVTNDSAQQIQRQNFELIKDMWFGNPGSNTADGQRLIDLSQRHVELSLDIEPKLQCTIGCNGNDCSEVLGSSNLDCEKHFPSSTVKQELVDNYRVLMATTVRTAWDDYNTDMFDIEMQTTVLERGWAGAGIWYNIISQINGAFINAITDVPSAMAYPMVMEEVRKERRARDSDITGLNVFTPHLQNGEPIVSMDNDDLAMAIALNRLYHYWNQEGGPDFSDQGKVSTGNIIEDIMNMVFGTHGLFQMRGANAHIHPLAQLSAVGKGLVDSAIRNVAIGTGTAALGGLNPSFAKNSGAILEGISGCAVSTAVLGLTAGVVLFYVLPFLPFVYFYFAVGTWLKGLFEAMVGVPLWALAHLRIDGDGLPGDSASFGYFLIFESFIRPILIVFGLAAATIIFTAQVRILNFIWGLVVGNLTGYQYDPQVTLVGDITIPRGTIDQFFFTVVYTIVVYMLATASFKLIDRIPDNILRWMGAGVSSFGDINEDPTQGLQKYAAFGGITIGQQATQGLREFSRGAGGALGGELGKLGTRLGGGAGGAP